MTVAYDWNGFLTKEEQVIWYGADVNGIEFFLTDRKLMFCNKEGEVRVIPLRKITEVRLIPYSKDDWHVKVYYQSTSYTLRAGADYTWVRNVAERISQAISMCH